MSAAAKGLIIRNQITEGSRVHIIFSVHGVHYRLRLMERKWAIRKQKFGLLLYLILLDNKVFHQFSQVPGWMFTTNRSSLDTVEASASEGTVCPLLGWLSTFAVLGFYRLSVTLSLICFSEVP